MTTEWLDLVDEQGQVIGMATRTACRAQPALIHLLVEMEHYKQRCFL